MDKKILNEIKDILEGFLAEKDFTLVDALYRYAAKRPILSILVDRPQGGITLDECAVLNNQISELLDEKNLTNESYVLEVSSPGLNRPLKNIPDFRRCINRLVLVYTGESIKGMTQHSGIIKDVDENLLYLDIDSQRLQIPLNKIIKAKQIIKEE